MKNMLRSTLGLSLLTLTATVLYTRLAPKTPAVSEKSTVVEPTDAATRRSPLDENRFAVVNEARLKSLASGPYDGPSYKESNEPELNLKLANKKAPKERMPASAPAKTPKKTK